jgi:hypothetical protein
MVQVQKSTRLELEGGTPAQWYVETEPESGSFVRIAGAGDNMTPTSEVEYVFPEFGVYRVKAITSSTSDYTENSETAKIHEFAITAKVIRYEIRDLTDADRELYFDALHTFYMIGQVREAQ